MKKQKNFLDCIPCCNPLYGWETDENGMVTVHVVNKGFFHWIAQKFFKRPPVSHIKLDEYGSFVWKQMDGEKTIFEISDFVKEKYGTDAEPLLGRLVKYFQILYQIQLIKT